LRSQSHNRTPREEEFKNFKILPSDDEARVEG